MITCISYSAVPCINFESNTHNRKVMFLYIILTPPPHTHPHTYTHTHTHTHTHRLLFSSVLKCRSWFDRLLECKRSAHKDIKNVFAFIYRAYRKDQKLSRPWGESGDNGVANVTEPAESREAGGVDGLLSLQSECTYFKTTLGVHACTVCTMTLLAMH